MIPLAVAPSGLVDLGARVPSKCRLVPSRLPSREVQCQRACVPSPDRDRPATVLAAPMCCGRMCLTLTVRPHTLQIHLQSQKSGRANSVPLMSHNSLAHRETNPYIRNYFQDSTYSPLHINNPYDARQGAMLTSTFASVTFHVINSSHNIQQFWSHIASTRFLAQ